MIYTLTDLVRCKQYQDPRINPRTRDLDCEVGSERSDRELDAICLEIELRTVGALVGSAIMFNEPQFQF